MKFTQPRLPYLPDALKPAISPVTIDFHYGKHEKAYIDTLNTLIEGTEYADMELEEIIKKSDGPLFNAASQAWNHIFYFFQFSPDGKKEPTGDLRVKIDDQFGDFEDFKKEFVANGVGLFGSGWVWLSTDADGKLFITKESNAGTPLKSGLTPLMTFDVWEHAYYLDFQNRRKDALEALWDIVDWKVIEERYNTVINN